MKAKLQNLWRYLKMRDDETLIVASHNHQTNTAEYLIADLVGGELRITSSTSIPTPTANKPMQIITRRGSDGKYEIPIVEQLERERRLDY